VILRSSAVEAGSADAIDGIQKYQAPGMPSVMMIGQGNNSYVGFKQLDLTGISSITFVTAAPKQYGMIGGSMEVRIDSPTGEVIGESSPIVATAPSGQQMAAPILATASIKATTGFHDIYFIYKNESGGAGQSLFVLMNIHFAMDTKKQLSMN
jgi:cytochrome c